MLEKHYKMECIGHVQSVFHVYYLQRLLDDPVLLREEVPIPRRWWHVGNLPGPWKNSTKDIFGCSFPLADCWLTPDVARQYLDNGIHDLECIRAVMCYMENIWREYHEFSARIFKRGLVDIRRFMARKTGRGCLGDSMSLDPDIQWDNFSIGKAFVETRGANELVRDFFDSEGIGAFKRFDPVLWGNGVNSMIGPFPKRSGEVLNEYEQILPQFLDICRDFLQTGFSIEDYAVHRFFPDVYINPLLYVDNEYKFISIFAKKIVSGDV